MESVRIKSVVDLIDAFDDMFGVIIAFPSGVLWLNQTHGSLCRASCLEGVFVPLSGLVWYEATCYDSDSQKFPDFDPLQDWDTAPVARVQEFLERRGQRRRRGMDTGARTQHRDVPGFQYPAA